MEIDIDFDCLREDLKSYFGTASFYFPPAMMDLIDVDSCSDMELLNLIKNTPYNLDDYINDKSL